MDKINPFLINVEDKYEYNLEDYKNIQEQLSNKIDNIKNIVSNYYPPKSYFYEMWDFQYRCTKSLKQQLIDVSNNRLPIKQLYKIGDGGD